MGKLLKHPRVQFTTTNFNAQSSPFLSDFHMLIAYMTNVIEAQTRKKQENAPKMKSMNAIPQIYKVPSITDKNIFLKLITYLRVVYTFNRFYIKPMRL